MTGSLLLKNILARSILQECSSGRWEGRLGRSWGHLLGFQDGRRSSEQAHLQWLCFLRRAGSVLEARFPNWAKWKLSGPSQGMRAPGQGRGSQQGLRPPRCVHPWAPGTATSAVSPVATGTPCTCGVWSSGREAEAWERKWPLQP